MKKFLVILFILVSSTLFAEGVGSMSITPKAQFAYGLGDVHKSYNPGLGLGGDFGYTVMDKLTIEGGISFMYWIGDEEDYGNGYSVETSMWMMPFTAGVRYDLSAYTGMDFSVIGGLGLTYVSVNFDSSGSDSEFGMLYGGGSYDETDLSMYLGAEFAFSKIVVRPKLNFVFWGGSSSKSIWIDLGYRIGL